MRKKLLAGIVVPLVAVLGLWFGFGGSATAHAPRKATHVSGMSVVSTVHRTSPHIRAVHLKRANAVRAADVAAGSESGAGSESETTTESESETGTESDGIDCQQEGNFEGVNAAGTGPGCTGAGV